MKDKQEVKAQEQKSKKSPLRLIFWLLLISIVLITAKLVFDEVKFGKDKDFFADEQFDNIDSEIYDMSVQDAHSPETPDIRQSTTLKPKRNPRFGDQIPPYNPQHLAEIKELQENYQLLKEELNKIKNQDKLSKIIISFVELRRLVLSGQNYSNQLQELELLSRTDSNLAIKVKKLAITLKNKPKTEEQIKKEFEALVPKIIAKKYDLNSDNSLFSKVKNNISKLVLVRRIDGVVKNDDDNIDSIIAKSEGFMKQSEYQEVLDEISLLPEDYQPLLVRMIVDLKTVIELREINSDIFSYLKTL